MKAHPASTDGQINRDAQPIRRGKGPKKVADFAANHCDFEMEGGEKKKENLLHSLQ